MIIKSASPDTRRRQKALFDLLYAGLCESYWSEKALLQWLPDPPDEINDHSLQSSLAHYRLVALAHVQKCGNVFGHLDREGNEKEQLSIRLLLESKGRGGIIAKDYRFGLLLLQVVHLKAAQYRTLSFYADSVGLPMAGSILRRMYSEECEAIAILGQDSTDSNTKSRP